MKKIISFSTVLIIGLLITSFFNQVNAQSATTKSPNEQQVSKKYTCSMHPEIVMNKPGDCPKCGMALEEKTDSKKGGMTKMHDMKNMKNMQDTTKMKCDSTKMKKCCD
jgi:hypothetical protein